MPAAFCAGFSTLSAGEDGTVLSPHFIKGKVYGYESETSVTLRIPSQSGQPMEQRVTMKHQAALKIGDRPGGAGVAIDAGTDFLVLNISSGDKGLSYDSRDDSQKDTAIARHFAGALQRSVLVEIDEKGKVVKTTEHGGGGPATPMPGMPQFGPDELKQLVLSLLQVFGPDPVKPGDEWTHRRKRSLGQFGEMDFKIAYTYHADKDFSGVTCAVIEYKGEMQGDVAISGSQPGSDGGKLSFEDAYLSGRLIFDKRGRAVQLNEQNVKMKIDIPQPDATAGEMLSLPMEQKVTTRLTSVKDG
jgi:hypothetical protein